MSMLNQESALKVLNAPVTKTVLQSGILNAMKLNLDTTCPQNRPLLVYSVLLVLIAPIISLSYNVMLVLTVQWEVTQLLLEMVSKETSAKLNTTAPWELVYLFPARTTHGNHLKVKHLAMTVKQVMYAETQKKTCAQKIVSATEMKISFMAIFATTVSTPMVARVILALTRATLATLDTSAWEVKKQANVQLATSVSRKPIRTHLTSTTKLILVLWDTIVNLDQVHHRDALSRPTLSKKELSS
jgi:hypothetical protein